MQKKQIRQLIIYYLAGLRHPEKQNPPLVRRGVNKGWTEGKTRSASLPSWKKFSDVVAIPSASPRISRASTHTHTHMRVHTHTCAHIHTFLPACSRVQIGIEKSRSQLKLEAQRIRRDKIPIISCPRPSRPPPLSPFPASTKRWRRRGRSKGGGGRVGVLSLARTQFH